MMRRRGSASLTDLQKVIHAIATSLRSLMRFY